MLSRAMTRRIFVRRSGKCRTLQEVLRGQAEALLEPGPRFPAEELACAGDVRPGVANVAGPLWLLVPFDRASEQRADRLGELVDRRGPAGRDVEDSAADALRSCCGDVRVDNVLDVGEVAALLAVAVHLDGPPVRDRRDEARHDGRVLRRR